MTKLEIRVGVAGPAGQAGLLLFAPRTEALEWDIQHEIASTSWCWMEEEQAWWIAAPYLETARRILHRFESTAGRGRREHAPLSRGDAGLFLHRLRLKLASAFELDAPLGGVTGGT